jgi:hypothetical protein
VQRQLYQDRVPWGWLRLLYKKQFFIADVPLQNGFRPDNTVPVPSHIGVNIAVGKLMRVKYPSILHPA